LAHQWRPGGDEPAERRAYLHAGRLFASTQPTAVTTILGSCVAVCLWDPRLEVGGINHFLLPHWVGNGLASPRFGNVAVGSLIEQLLGFGSRKQDLQAKLFGGASVLGASAREEAHLGKRNVEIARKLLGQEGILVVAEDVGGRQGRRLIFHTEHGTAWVRPL
jgi:chemotaxis protein CheD